MMSLCANKVAPNFDDVILCKHVTAEEMHLSCLIPYLIRKKIHVILAINIVIAHIAILITSSPSGARFYVMRWVKYGRWRYHKISR